MTSVITRNPATKTATLAVDTAGHWRVFAGKDIHSINFSAPLATGDGPKTLELPLTVWACFAVQAEACGKAPLLLAERHLPMTGGYNFRDLGGLPSADGKHVASGYLNSICLDNISCIRFVALRSEAHSPRIIC